jgi:hypothetical protein
MFEELWAEVGGKAGVLMMLAAWAFTEYLGEPLAHRIVMHRWAARVRKELSWLKKAGKWFSAAILIYPVALFMPGAQPPLCDPPDIDLGSQCYTILEQWVMPGVLGAAVSSGHFGTKFLGFLASKGFKKEPPPPKAKHKIHCFNCDNKKDGKKVSVRVSDWDDPCPNCGVADPHNPKNGNGK